MASRFFISKHPIRSKSVKFLYSQKCDYSDEKQKGNWKKSSEKDQKSQKRFSKLFESLNFEVKPQPYRKAAATNNSQKFPSLHQILKTQVTIVKIWCFGF